MNEFTEIILRLLWRFYPIAWLTTAIVRGLSTLTSWLEEDDYFCLLAVDRQECAWIGGWLALAEERLNELITMKAMKRLNRPWLPPDPCGHHRARAVTTPQEICRRLARLCILYHDHKRLFELRAIKLQRLFAAAELRLEVVHHPIESTTTTIFRFTCSTTTTILRASRIGDDFRHPGEPHSAQPIRGPPGLGLRSPYPAHPNP